MFSCSDVTSRWRRTWKPSIRSWKRDDVNLRRRERTGRPSNVYWSSRKCTSHLVSPFIHSLIRNWSFKMVIFWQIYWVFHFCMNISIWTYPHSPPIGLWKRIRRKGRSSESFCMTSRSCSLANPPDLILSLCCPRADSQLFCWRPSSCSWSSTKEFTFIGLCFRQANLTPI